MVDYANVPIILGTLVSAEIATLYELQSCYGVKDAYDLLEIVTVDRHNEWVSNADRN